MSTDTSTYPEEDDVSPELYERLAERYSGTEMERVFEILGQSLENEEANS